jgi:hypothetical protein
LGHRQKPATRNIPELGISENKVGLGLPRITPLACSGRRTTSTIERWSRPTFALAALQPPGLCALYKSLHSGDRGSPKRTKALAGVNPSLDGPVVLLQDIIEVLHRPGLVAGVQRSFFGVDDMNWDAPYWRLLKSLDDPPNARECFYACTCL